MEGINKELGEGLGFDMIQGVIADSPAPVLDLVSSRLLWSCKGIADLSFSYCLTDFCNGY